MFRNGILTDEDIKRYREKNFDTIQNDIIKYFEKPDDVAYLSDISNIDRETAQSILKNILSFCGINSLSDNDKKKLLDHTSSILRKYKQIYVKWRDSRKK